MQVFGEKTSSGISYRRKRPGVTRNEAAPLWIKCRLRQECATSIRNSLNGILEYRAARLQQIHERLGQFIRNHHLDRLYVLEMHIESTFGDPSLAYDVLDRYGFDRLFCI